MAYFKDLSEYEYHAASSRPGTKNVGWLEPGQEFAREEPAEATLGKIWDFCKVSVAQMRGIHDCEFCSGHASFVERNGETLQLGTSEIRVFSPGGTIYAAPTLIYHYLKSHSYRPPDEFLRALEEGPAPPSQEYFDRLKALGLEWNATSAPEQKPVRYRLTREGFKPVSE